MLQQQELQNPESPSLRELSLSLQKWFLQNARDLPWRGAGRTAWKSLVSEYMLQQTTVATVVPRFLSFLDRFPTARHLASASEDDVVSAWQGLGYYRRARFLRKCAIAICERFEGEVPPAFEDLESLPGIGPYTAAAVTSIAFGHKAPVVDGNVIRVFARLFGMRHRDLVRFRHQASRWLQGLRTADEVRRHNEALMEFGATMCRPRNPDCRSCFFSTNCVALATGQVATLPVPAARSAQRSTQRILVMVRHKKKYLLERIPRGQLCEDQWNGLLSEPLSASENASRSFLEFCCARLTQSGVSPARVISRGAIQHTVYNERMRISVVEFEASTEAFSDRAALRWVDPGSTDLPVATVLRKSLALMG